MTLGIKYLSVCLSRFFNFLNSLDICYCQTWMSLSNKKHYQQQSIKNSADFAQHIIQVENQDEN